MKIRFLLDLSTAVMAKHNALAQASPKPCLKSDRDAGYTGLSHLSIVQSNFANTPEKSERFHIFAKSQLESSAGKEEKKSAGQEEKKSVEVGREELSVNQIRELIAELKNVRLSRKGYIGC